MSTLTLRYRPSIWVLARQTSLWSLKSDRSDLSLFDFKLFDICSQEPSDFIDFDRSLAI